MEKKRFLLAVLLVGILVVLSSEVFAGCCQGMIGCSRAFFESECASVAVFDTRECEDIYDCSIVACCHDIPGVPKATYLSTCQHMTPTPDYIYIKDFTTNPSAESAYANSLCAGAKPPCQYVNCELQNVVDCMCGSALTTSTSQFCCARDHSVFPSFGACTASPSCRFGTFYNLHGRVVTPSGQGIAGADVRAGTGYDVTDENGNFTIELVPDLSSGTIVAMKNLTINSTPYTVAGGDVYDKIVVLDIKEGPVAGVEVCIPPGTDDDGDQFGWASPVVDTCDSDCLTVSRTVTQAYYTESERYSLAGVFHDLCSDRLDNNCDGLMDCADPACVASPACTGTKCGDGVIQFPDSQGVYEQCDMNYTTGAGNDSLCPGKCVAEGKPRQCTCQYEAVCGNGIVDYPLESCDGIFLASVDTWDSSQYNTGSDCTIDQCGKPSSSRPCQCPPPQLCGNGVKEEPEQCDLGNPAGGISPASGNCDGCSPDCTCPPAEVICGDNILGRGEDCDGSLNILGTGWELFKTRKYACGPDMCAVPDTGNDETTYLGPVNEEHLDGRYSVYADYTSALGVDSACKCRTDCRASPLGPDLGPVTQTRFERRINLNWSDACAGSAGDNARGYNVFRCAASGPDGAGCNEPGSVYTIINDAPLGVTTQFTDTNFQGSGFESPKHYCYFVQGLYGDTITPTATVPLNFGDETLGAFSMGKFDASIHCIKAGMEQCFTFKSFYPWAEEFCADPNMNVRSTCDENNSIVTVTPVTATDKVDCNIAVEEFGSMTNFICVGPYAESHPTKAGKTECIPTSVCDYCNDPFGLFGYSSSIGRSWGIDSSDSGLSTFDFGKAPTSEPDEDHKVSRTGYKYCNQLDICYMDYSFTNVNKFYAYGVNSSCYDFHSLSACAKFNDTIGGGSCEWVWHPEFGELGIGVCRTNITDDQQCERCHDPLNEVFGYCNKESCALYGRCYYDADNLDQGYDVLADMTTSVPPVKRAQKEGNTYYRCTHERDISCENYDSLDDCIGSASQYSIGGVAIFASDVDVDVSGNLSDLLFVKTAGTNEILTKSDDFFGFGECQWVYTFANYSEYDVLEAEDGTVTRLGLRENVTEIGDFYCIKNSDDSPKVVDFEESEYESQLYERQESDCGGVGEDNGFLSEDLVPSVQDCRKDFTDPVTTIPHYEDDADPMHVRGDFEFPAIVFDNSRDYASAVYYPDTYACVASLGYYCYPNGTAAKLGPDQGNLVRSDNVGFNLSYDFSIKGFQSGLHVIRYFSEDISHNLEPVRNFTVYMDADAPRIRLEFSNVSYELRNIEDSWRTNLTLAMYVDYDAAIPGDDRFAFCSAMLYLGNISIYPGQDIINEYNDSWVRQYDSMPDDHYTFWYHCEDDVGNVAENNVTFVIDGDRSITNPHPTGTLNQETVGMGVETGTDANCRYLEDVSDNPAFWSNRSFDPTVFDSMTEFSMTGREGSPSTIHGSDMPVSHGYHRFYVKCRMSADGVIRGNAADQIRFAIDTEPPVTTHSTDSSPYNAWFNQDIDVALSCGDPSIMGNGLDWSFGCDKTYYCFGEGCASLEGRWKNYTAPLMLNQTTYLSYYSVDKGGNAAEPVRDVLFQIDKSPPDFTIEFYDGTSLADVIVMGVVYKIKVTSSKPLISPAVSVPRMTYVSQPSKFAGSIAMLPTADLSVWEGLFFMENINANRGFEGDGVFTVAADDYHNVSGSGSNTIRIDTKPPEAPVLEPSLESPSRDASEYQVLGYPVHYYNGTYYTNKGGLFITGYTSEYLDMYAVTSVEDVDSESIFTQTPTLKVYDDSALSGFIGQHEVKVVGDILRRVNNSLFMGFDKEETTMGPKTKYGEYGMFYDITNLVYVGGDEQYTKLTIYPELEESLKLDRKLVFYDKEYPSYWFGFDVPLATFRNTTFYLKSYDAANNLVRYPPISQLPPYLVFFSDPAAPSVVKHFPRDGSTSKSSMDVGIIVKEGRQESGLFNRSVNFTVNNKAVPFSISRDESLEALDLSNYYYRISYAASNLADGDYDVAVSGKDLALNAFSESEAASSWSFSVDRKLPADPVFTLVGGFPDYTGMRWYSRTSPDFIVDFSEERNPVTIVDVMMEDSPTEGGAASCENTSRNVFLCRFSSPKTSSGVFWADYGVIVRALKTLDDGTNSSTGNYGPFQFTVDDQPPNFIPVMQTRFMDLINLTMGAVVTNENHPLFADIEIFGEHHAPYYSSSNGTFYYFMWDVDDYTKDQEGPTTLTLTLSDFAQNKRSVSIPVYLDLTAPRLENISIDISNTVQIGTELFTALPNVTVTGRFVDDDIDKVWVMPGDFNASSLSYADKKYADIKYVGGVPESFTASVRLMDPGVGTKVRAPLKYNFMLINQVNNMTLYVRDKAGHVSHRKLKVMTDMVPPGSPRFCLGEDWVSCMPSMP